MLRSDGMRSNWVSSEPTVSTGPRIDPLAFWWARGFLAAAARSHEPTRRSNLLQAIRFGMIESPVGNLGNETDVTTESMSQNSHWI